MISPPIPADEAARLADLRDYAVLDSGRELAFDRITKLASTLFEVPMVVVSLVDEARQWFKATIGVDGTETARELSFCGHAIHEPTPMVVADALDDRRFFDNPFVTGNPHVRFYAGAPLTTPRGHRIGTLCVMDSKPRQLTGLQTQVLADMAALVVDQLELRLARMRAEREVESLQLLFNTLPVPISVITRGTVVFANPSMASLLKAPVNRVVGHSVLDFVPAEDREAARNRATNNIATRETVDRRMLALDGTVVHVHATSVETVWRGQRALIVSMRDVALERAIADARERRSKEVSRELGLLQSVFDGLPSGVALFDDHFRCVYANRAMGDVFGLSSEAILGWTPDDAARHVASLSTDPNHVLERMARMRQVSTGHSTDEVFTLVKPRPRVLRRTLHALGIPTRPYVVVWTDVSHEVSELKRSEEAASTDSLTKLPNRRAAEAHLVGLLGRNQPTSVVLFDVDHFKRVNDTFGHAAGDQVLQSVGRALREVVREGELVARWGGEEFIAVVQASRDGAMRFAERARAAIERLETAAGRVTASAGVAGEIRNLNEVERADAKLYEAKRNGRNRVEG